MILVKTISILKYYLKEIIYNNTLLDILRYFDFKVESPSLDPQQPLGFYEQNANLILLSLAGRISTHTAYRQQLFPDRVDVI